MKMELKTFFSPGWESFLLSSRVVRELNGFVSGWEMNQAWKESNPMKTSFQNIFRIDILLDIVPNERKLSWLDTLNSHGNVYNESYEPEAETHAAASLAWAHLVKSVTACFKAVFHISLLF